MNWISALLILPALTVSTAFSFVSCSHAPVKTEENTPTPIQLGPTVSVAAPSKTPSPSEPAPNEAKPLTAVGENGEARYSASGDRIIFVSRWRPNHKQAQVYELQLDRMIEKRLTFHDGDDAGPIYTPDGQKFIFSSTTDEIKEGRAGVDRLMKIYAPEALDKNTPPSDQFKDGHELYLQTTHGRVIERLTQSPGFDGEPDVDGSGKRIVLSSEHAGSGARLYLLIGKSLSSLTDGKSIDRSPRFSKDGQFLVWVRQIVNSGTPPTTQSQLMVANGNFRKPKVLFETSGNFSHRQPFWSPDGSEIVFSSNMGGKFFNLFTIDKEGKCVRRLTSADFDNLHPSFSPDGKSIIFTMVRNSHSQIYQMEYKKPNECWQTVGSITQPTPAVGAASGPGSGPASGPTSSPTGKTN